MGVGTGAGAPEGSLPPLLVWQVCSRWLMSRARLAAITSAICRHAHIFSCVCHGESHRALTAITGLDILGCSTPMRQCFQRCLQH